MTGNATSPVFARWMLQLGLAVLLTGLAGCAETAEVIEPPGGAAKAETTTKISVFFTLFSHGVLFDVCAAIPLFYKGHRHYLRSHAAVSYLFFALLVVEIGLLFRDSSFARTFHLQAFVFASMALQLVLGLWIERLITKKTNGRHFSFQKWLHKGLALAQWVAIKVQLYHAFAFLLTGRTLLFVSLTYYGLDVATLLLLAFFAGRSAPRNRIQPHYEKREFREVLRSLELNEFNPFESFSLAKDRTVIDNQSVSVDPSALDIKWYLAENRVVFLGDFEHSGGEFLLTHFAKRDLTRYLSGHLSFAYHCVKDHKVIFFRHAHGRFTKDHIARHTFGFVSEPIAQVSHKADVTHDTNVDPTNAFFAHRDAHLQANLFFDEVQDKNHCIEFQMPFHGEHSTLFFISRTDDESGHHTLDLSRYWLPMLGKYVMMGLDLSEVTYGWLVLSLTPNYRKMRARVLQFLDPAFYNYEAKFVTPELTRIEQKSDADAPKKVSKIFPVFSGVKGRLIHTSLSVSNLFGFGLSHLTKSADKYLLLLKDDGIVSFLDLFELATNFFLLEDSGKSHPDMIVSRDYMYLFSNQPTFMVKWVLTHGFAQSAKTLGLGQLHCLLEAQKKRAAKDKPMIFEQVQLVTELPELGVYSNLRVVRGSDAGILDLVGDKPETYDKVVVSGDDTWRQRLFWHAKVDEELFTKLAFV